MHPYALGHGHMISVITSASSSSSWGRHGQIVWGSVREGSANKFVCTREGMYAVWSLRRYLGEGGVKHLRVLKALWEEKV